MSQETQKKTLQVTAALIWRGKEFLICQRPKGKARELLWEFAGGKLEPGETFQEALVRECREELGIEISVGEKFMEVTHEYPDVVVHLILWNSTIQKGEPQKLEHKQLRWITAKEVDQYDFCPADKVILEKIKSL